MLKKILSNIQVFNSYFVNNIKDPYIEKTNEKSCLIIYIYNNKKKNFVLIYLPKILKISQSISYCFAIIIQNNNNDNIKFYLQDIIKVYIEIILYFNPNFYIWPFFKLLSQLSISFNFIVKVIKPLYSKSEAYNYQFAIYYLYYKEKPKITKFIYNYYLVSYLTTVVKKISQQLFCSLIIVGLVLLNQV